MHYQLFLKIGLTVTVLACSGNLFFDMPQVMILDRWQSLTLADIWTNLAGIQSGPVALLVSKDLIFCWYPLVMADQVYCQY